MKKYSIIAASVIILAGIGFGAYVLFNPSDKNAPAIDSITGSKVTFAPIDACDILTEDIAKEIIGANVQKTTTASSAVATNDISVSNCNYMTEISPTDTSSVPKVSGASLLIRVAKTSVGADSNKTQFLSKDADVQAVEGIGDDAFFNPSFRQLHVLKGNNWYIITAYKDSITNSSVDSNKKLAEKLNFQ